MISHQLKTDRSDHEADCMLCGKPLIYTESSVRMTCSICGRTFDSNAACSDGHFVCDSCHSAGSVAFFVPLLLSSREKDPQKLFDQVVALPRVHAHGPEHHLIIPCVLLTAYRNNGGSIDLEKAMAEAVKRGKNVPGGACGYWGTCGAAVSAGIYMSILTGSTPLNGEQWGKPQMVTSECLYRNAKTGGPRCCKRTGRTAIETAVKYTKKYLGITMPRSTPVCHQYEKNRECLGTGCPYYPTRPTGSNHS